MKKRWLYLMILLIVLARPRWRMIWRANAKSIRPKKAVWIA